MPRTSKRPRPSESETPVHVRQALAWIGRRGGKARARSLTPEQLREIGKKGAEARWGKKAGRRRPGRST